MNVAGVKERSWHAGHIASVQEETEQEVLFLCWIPSKKFPTLVKYSNVTSTSMNFLNRTHILVLNAIRVWWVILFIFLSVYRGTIIFFFVYSLFADTRVLRICCLYLRCWDKVHSGKKKGCTFHCMIIFGHGVVYNKLFNFSWVLSSLKKI